MNAAGSPRTIKIVLIGDSNVGKYITGRFSSAYRATIGADFIARSLSHHTNPDQAVVLQIWDTAGQERFSALSSAFFRGADAAIFMFDATRPDSVAGLRRWWDEFVAKCPLLEGTEGEFCAVFVGNKLDLLHEQAQHVNDHMDAGHQAGRSEQANGGARPITETLVQRFLQDLIPTKPGFVPSTAPRQRTIHVDGLSGVPLSQTCENHASQPGIPIEPLSHGRRDSESSDSGFEPESPPRSPSRSRPVGILSSSPRAHWIRSKSRGLSREGNGTATTNHTIYHTPVTSLFRANSPARGGPSRGGSPAHSQLRHGGSSVTTMETARSYFSASAPTQLNPSRTPSSSSTATKASEATVKPHRQPNTLLDGVPADCPELPTRESASLEVGPSLFWSSARTGEGVAPVFEYVARRVVQRWEWEESRLGFDDGFGAEDGPTALRIRADWGGGKRGWRSACC